MRLPRRWWCLPIVGVWAAVACSAPSNQDPSVPAPLASSEPAGALGGGSPAVLTSVAAASQVAPAASAASVAPRRVQVSFEDVAAGEGKREVFVVASELKLRESLVVYDEPGVCTLDPSPFRDSSEASKSSGSARSRRSRPPLPAGIWMRCGILESESVGIGAVAGGLQINNDLVQLPQDILLDLPTAAPEQKGLKPCPAGAAKAPLTASIEVRRPEPGRRTVALSIPALKQTITIAEMHDGGNCTSVISDHWGWLDHTCRSGDRWQHHSTDRLLARPVDGKLLLNLAVSSIDFHLQTSGAIALPCGAKVRFQGKNIRATGSSSYTGCTLSCYTTQGLCEDRCGQKFYGADGESTEESNLCEQACTEKANTCLAPCYAHR